MNSLFRLTSFAKRGFGNLLSGRPLAVSFEITHNCNANCRHCHRGGTVRENRASPARFGELSRELKPLVAQVSGGEPLLRTDVEDIVRAIQRSDGTPYIVFVTNAALLSEEKYYRLLDIGVDVFSVSLDFPDERHDEFRRIPGLFKHITSLVEKVDSGRKKAITFNSVVQSENVRELVKMAELARDCGVEINFSPYTWLRTNDMDFMIQKEDLPEFRDIIERLIDFKKRYNTIRTTDGFFYDMASFFENESLPDCRAGVRFLVVNPDGTLSPCGLIITAYSTQEELVSEFSQTNTCTYCHTCIRSGTEKPFNNLLTSAVKSIF